MIVQFSLVIIVLQGTSACKYLPMNPVAFRHIWAEIVTETPELYIAEDHSDLKLHGKIYIVTKGTVIKNYRIAVIEKSCDSIKMHEHQYVSLRVRISNIKGDIESFKYALNYHKHDIQTGKMTYDFDDYIFRADCILTRNSFCLDTCAIHKEIGEGIFSPNITYTKKDDFMNFPKEKQDVINGFMYTEIYKLGAHLGELVRKGLKKFSKCDPWGTR